MKVENKDGVILDFKTHESVNEPISVMLIRKGKSPQKIGTVHQWTDYTGDQVYYAYNADGREIVHPTNNWTDIETRLFKLAYEFNRTQFEKYFMRLAERTEQIEKIRKNKGLQVNKDLGFNH